ncbi:hypothetical protein D5086_003167 [Populus alba]|uniref:Uncharacterized protein n=1 Tax=Populus alba TaxID=43335 RepID=A0ACC4D5J2_POPAL
MSSSIVAKEAIEVIAQSIGITNLSPDVSLTLAPDVEYRLREIIQEAIKCMRHSRRTALTAHDVDTALILRNVEPIYGFGSGGDKAPLRFKRAAAAGHKDLYYIDDKDVNFKHVIEAPLPKPPLDTSLSSHWLAIEGVQPAIPENVPIEALGVISDGKKSDYKDDGLSIDVKLPVKDILSRELQLYFEKVTELTKRRSESAIFKQALVSLATDSGLHPLVPYFIQFIADEVSRNLNNFSLLFAVMRIARSLLQNPYIHIEPYLHQLMPSIITCLVAKRLGNRFSDNHWELRNFTANLVASICKRFGHAYHNLQPRIMRTLVHAFLDPTKSLPQHYGSIQGLAALGPGVRAAGLCMYDRLKMLPGLLIPPSLAIWKSNGRVMTSMPNKRKASTDHLMQQPPLKKIAADSAIGAMPKNSMPVEMQGAASGFPTAVGASSVSVSAISRQLSNENREYNFARIPRIVEELTCDYVLSTTVLSSQQFYKFRSSMPFSVFREVAFHCLGR